MAESFSIAFEEVELIDGLDANQAVWLFMRASVFDANDLETPLLVEQVGSLPPDANRASGDGFPVGDAGLYAPGLPIAEKVRNDAFRPDTGQAFPRFTLNPITVEPSQVVELMVIMLPKTWFKTVKVPPEDYERFATGAFGFLLGASGFGLVGAIAGAIFGWFVQQDEEADAPCFQSVITARHLLSFDDLMALRSEGSRRFGPKDNDISLICGEIDSFYWISADRHSSWSFGPTRPIEAGDCKLEPWRHYPVETWLRGTWLDGPSWAESCAGLSMGVDGEFATVWLYDTPNVPGSSARIFERRPITVDIPRPVFTGNIYDHECPARSVAPVCHTCRRFTNMPLTLRLTPKMLAAIALGSRHEGAQPWAHALLPVPGKALPAPGCDEARRLRKLSDRRAALTEPRSLGRGTMFRQIEDGRFEIWPKGTRPSPPLPGPPARPITLEDLASSELREIDKVPHFLGGSFLIELNERERLYSYAEVPAKGEPHCPRLRYQKQDADGAVVADVMLAWYTPPPH
ncbi:hypothetical protein [Sphingomonas koreensis]